MENIAPILLPLSNLFLAFSILCLIASHRRNTKRIEELERNVRIMYLLKED